VRLVWQFAAVAAVALIGSQAVAATGGNPWATCVLGVLTAALAVAVYRWVVRRTERRTPAEVAGKGAAAATGWGTLGGVALFAAVIAAIALCGGYEVTGFGSVPGAVGLVGLMAAAAVTEELLFRGILFRIAEERLGTWLALVLTSVPFGLIHLVNPHADLWGALAVAIEAGGMLTAAYAATRNLWVPIGLHFGWNFAASGLFSTEVSGNDTPQGLLDAVTSGPVLLTGGDFGPEGSLFAVLFCVLATVGFVVLARRRGRLAPRRRRDAAATTLPR